MCLRSKFVYWLYIDFIVIFFNNIGFYWDGTTCQRKKTYDGGCTLDYECFQTKDLICQTVVNSCDCPNTSAIGYFN